MHNLEFKAYLVSMDVSVFVLFALHLDCLAYDCASQTSRRYLFLIKVHLKLELVFSKTSEEFMSITSSAAPDRPQSSKKYIFVTPLYPPNST